MKTKENLEKKAREAISKAADAVKMANEALTEATAAMKIMEELSEDDLEQVSGAGNPFEDIPRVPNQVIDPDLRDDV